MAKKEPHIALRNFLAQHGIAHEGWRVEHDMLILKRTEALLDVKARRLWETKVMDRLSKLGYTLRVRHDSVLAQVRIHTQTRKPDLERMRQLLAKL